jgi:hypothetical protein
LLTLHAELIDFFENTFFVPWFKEMCGGEKNMPHFVDKSCNTLAERLWLSRVRRPIEHMAQSAVNPKLQKERSAWIMGEMMGEPTKGKNRFIAGFRSWFLYHWMPYDQNTWTKIHDSWFVLFNVCLCLPSASAHALFYTLLLLLIDRSDEYQLITLVRSYKAFQFFSAGVVGLVIGGTLHTPRTPRTPRTPLMH